MFDRLNRALQGALDPDKVNPRLRQPTLETLLPGDVVSMWDYGDAVVQTVLACREELNRRVTEWRWNLLDDGRMLSVAPEGSVLYERTVVLHQDTAEFETLTCDPEQGGVLKAFEARVREGTAARNPTLFEFEGRVYRVLSTGIFDARPVGTPTFPKSEVWRDINPTNAGDNVYFELEPTEDVPPGESGGEVLGIWTSHIALLLGRDLKAADVQAIYPRSEQEGTAR
ncbi:MAG TPA: hypothetical protein VFG86_00780 [Chloroflexota bacterium]|jgi:hypothetical protein|nr:hypothetical protein [Chloroflexota bacterium]